MDLSHISKNKIFQSNGDTPKKHFAGMCHYHPSNAITNFDRKTLMPLCPKCISQHLQACQQQGQVSEIESIEQMHMETQQILASLMTRIREALQKINEFTDIKHDAHNSLHDSIQHAKQKAQRVLDAYFDQLQHELSQVTMQDKTSIDEDIKQAEKFMAIKLQEIVQYEEKIHGQKFLKYLVKIHSGQFIAEHEQYAKECHDYIDQLSKKTLDININDDKLYSLNIELAKFVQIKNAEFYLKDNLQNQKQQGDFRNPYIESRINLGISQMQGGFKQDFIKSQFNDDGVKNFSRSQRPGTLNSFVININDYFEPLASNKTLHHFEDGTRIVHLYSVDTIINPNKKPSWRDVQLDINFTVPLLHSTIRTSSGQIYLLGGVMNKQVIGSIWRLDLNSKALLLLTEELISPRYGHVSIFINNKIYIFGGANTQDLVSSESFDLQYDSTLPNSQNKTKQYRKGLTQLANAKYGGKNQTVCSFRQRFVLKISSQGSEIYDITKNIWQQIQINIPILSDCGMVQVNNSCILIFGGSSKQCPYGQLKIQDPELKFAYEPLQDAQNVAGRIATSIILPGTLVYQGKVYSIGMKQQTAFVVVGMSDQWII